MEYSSKNSFHTYKYQHQSHNCEFFLFLTDTTRQATIHSQPRSTNIFIQHEKKQKTNKTSWLNMEYAKIPMPSTISN